KWSIGYGSVCFHQAICPSGIIGRVKRRFISRGVCRDRSAADITSIVAPLGGRQVKSKGKPMQRTTNEPSALRQVPRCGARTRSGKPCQSPVVKGKPRCRMHGGSARLGGVCTEK